MSDSELLQQTIEHFWDTIPPVWGQVRGNARANAIRDFNLTLIQFHILRHIRRGARSMSALAERLQISRPAVTQAVDLLVAKGLVSRSPGQPDRRYVQLSLTESGSGLLEAVFSKNRRWMAEQMAHLTSAELETIMEALTLLKTTFDPANDEPLSPLKSPCMK